MRLYPLLFQLCLAATLPPVPHSYRHVESKRGAEKLIQRKPKLVPVQSTVTIGWNWNGTNQGVTFNVWEVRTNRVVAPSTTTWRVITNVPDKRVTLPIDKTSTAPLVLWSVTATNSDTWQESDFATP